MDSLRRARLYYGTDPITILFENFSLCLVAFIGQDCDKNLLYDLVLKLKPVLFLPGDYICRKVFLNCCVREYCMQAICMCLKTVYFSRGLKVVSRLLNRNPVLRVCINVPAWSMEFNTFNLC